MAEVFDQFGKGLQSRLLEETRKSYGQIAFDRWLRPLYVGTIDRPDGYGRVSDSCGNTIELFLRFAAGRVREATFQTNGCGASTVCGSFAAELSIGKNPDELAEITGDAILQSTGGLPREERHCAFLAAETLRAALIDYLSREGFQ